MHIVQTASYQDFLIAVETQGHPENPLWVDATTQREIQGGTIPTSTYTFMAYVRAPLPDMVISYTFYRASRSLPSVFSKDDKEIQIYNQHLEQAEQQSEIMVEMLKSDGRVVLKGTLWLHGAEIVTGEQLPQSVLVASR